MALKETLHQNWLLLSDEAKKAALFLSRIPEKNSMSPESLGGIIDPTKITNVIDELGSAGFIAKTTFIDQQKAIIAAHPELDDLEPDDEDDLTDEQFLVVQALHYISEFEKDPTTRDTWLSPMVYLEGDALAFLLEATS